MKLWMSAEIDGDVIVAYTASRKAVEAAVNEVLQIANLPSTVPNWDVIAILRATPSPDYDEVSRYHKRDNSLEFRLAIDHVAFANADATDQQRLILQMLARSIAMMPRLGVTAAHCAVITDALREAGERLVGD